MKKNPGKFSISNKETFLISLIKSLNQNFNLSVRIYSLKWKAPRFYQWRHRHSNYCCCYSAVSLLIWISFSWRRLAWRTTQNIMVLLFTASLSVWLTFGKVTSTITVIGSVYKSSFTIVSSFSLYRGLSRVYKKNLDRSS